MFYINPYFRNPTHRITISVIGIGGTGSFILSRLARLNFALQEMGHLGLHVKAFDPDIIEYFNVGRQNFLPTDVGENKATCMIEKCNFSYGLDWEAYEEYHSGVMDSNITICCVDNMKFRKILYKSKINSRHKEDFKIPYYLIDCGNGKDFGQVILSNVNDENRSKSIQKLKTLYDIFPNADKQDTTKIQGTRGCSYKEKLEEQDLFINDSIAVDACELLKKMLTVNSIDYQGCIINQSQNKKLPIKI